MKPTFSIITPTYNRGYILWKVIQSIQKQTFPDWELLIIDDGSTDDTKKVIAEFQTDPRIKYYFRKKAGASDARNFGLGKVKGRIVTYVDSDDVLYENYLQTAREMFAKYPKTVFAIGNYNRRLELIDADYKVVDFIEMSSAQKIDISLQDFYHWNVHTCGTGIFHTKEILKEGLRWDTSIRMMEDWDFILQIGRKFPKGFLHIPYVSFEYLQRYGGDGICSNTTYQEMAEAFEKIYQKHKNDPLMKGQKWYPAKVTKFKKRQKDFEAGKFLAPEERYFPDYKKE